MPPIHSERESARQAMAAALDPRLVQTTKQAACLPNKTGPTSSRRCSAVEKKKVVLCYSEAWSPLGIWRITGSLRADRRILAKIRPPAKRMNISGKKIKIPSKFIFSIYLRNDDLLSGFLANLAAQHLAPEECSDGPSKYAATSNDKDIG